MDLQSSLCGFTKPQVFPRLSYWPADVSLLQAVSGLVKDSSVLKMVFIKAPFDLDGSGLFCALLCDYPPCASVSFVPFGLVKGCKTLLNSAPLCAKNACVCAVRTWQQCVSKVLTFVTPCYVYDPLCVCVLRNSLCFVRVASFPDFILKPSLEKKPQKNAFTQTCWAFLGLAKTTPVECGRRTQVHNVKSGISSLTALAL